MNKKGAYSDLFLFMILAIVIVFICAIFIFLGGKALTEIHTQLDGRMEGSANLTEVVDNTIGKVNQSYQALYWISWFLIVGMILSIFIGSYLVTTKPVFFIPYIFIVIIAIVVSVGISNAYATVMEDPTLATTFSGFVGANYILNYLPIWIAVIGITGGIIMFARMGSGDQGGVYYNG